MNRKEKEAVLLTLQVHFRINKDFTRRGGKEKWKMNRKFSSSFYKRDLSKTELSRKCRKSKEEVSFLRSIY